MDPNKIGNARQQDDNRIAVGNALGLGECHRQLADQFMARDLLPTDYVAEQKAHYEAFATREDGSIDGDAVKVNIMLHKAIVLLRNAIADGQLRIWRIHKAREVALAPLRLDEGNIRYGVFKTNGRPEPDMEGALLWVKKADWESFLESVAGFSDTKIGDKKIEKPARQKPGPKPNPHWPEVIRIVTEEAIAADYRTPLEHGQKEALIDLICRRMGEIAGWDCSEAIAGRRVKDVIGGLPDR
ncbi:MAG: hypothetical protein VX454_00635 [Pseudomonadota bacterium]|nr:hypothetical protein [Pseudomonadota bacterium]